MSSPTPEEEYKYTYKENFNLGSSREPLTSSSATYSLEPMERKG